MPASGDRPKRLSREERRVQLLDVAVELFLARGFAQVTMEDIARSAGVTRPIPYRHFESREGIYLACVERERDEFQRRMITEVVRETDPVAQLRRGGAVFFDLLDTSPGRWRLLFGSGAAVVGGERARALEELRFGTIDVIEALLRESARPDLPSETVTAIAHAISGIGERLGHWKLRQPEITTEQLLEHFMQVVLAGVGPHLPPSS